MSTHLSQQVKFSFSLPAHHSQTEETFGTKGTFSVCLFIPVLAQYLFTPVTHLFALSRSRSPLRLSLTHRRCSRERKIWVTI